MSGSARWAFSALDLCVHLLSPADSHPAGLLRARCRHLMFDVATQHHQPPPGTPCERCSAIYLADVTAAHDTAVTDPPDPGRPLVELPPQGSRRPAGSTRINGAERAAHRAPTCTHDR